MGWVASRNNMGYHLIGRFCGDIGRFVEIRGLDDIREEIKVYQERLDNQTQNQSHKQMRYLIKLIDNCKS